MKTLDLGGGRELPQMWIDQRLLRPVQGMASPTMSAIVGYFLERCRQDNGASRTLEHHQLETYTLARLYPLAKTSAQNTVIQAASVASAAGKANRKSVSNLLRKAVGDECSSRDLQRIAKSLLCGPLEEIDAIGTTYREMAEKLFAAAQRDLRAGHDDLPEAMETWQAWRKTLRRGGSSKVHRKVLDILSAEARSAFHTCYSAVWEDLTNRLYRATLRGDREIVEPRLPELAGCFSLPFQLFHRLWHTEMSWPDPEKPDTVFRLMLGSPLALHPIAALLIGTPEMRKLLGDLVFGLTPETMDSDQMLTCSRQLFTAAVVAVSEYASIHAESLESRREQSRWAKSVTGQQGRSKNMQNRVWKSNDNGSDIDDLD